MPPTNRVSCHPGEILLNEYLQPLKITQEQLSQYTKIPIKQIKQICAGKSSINLNIAMKFAEALETTPNMWINLQANHDISKMNQINLSKKKSLIPTSASKPAPVKKWYGRDGNGIIPMPSEISIANGGVQCDMASGPCSCGGWHSRDEWIRRIESGCFGKSKSVAQILVQIVDDIENSIHRKRALDG